MAEAKAALKTLEDAINLYDQVFGILFALALTDEQGKTLYQSLVDVEDHIIALGDTRLSQLYGRLIEGHRTFVPKYKEVLAADYTTFLQKACQAFVWCSRHSQRGGYSPERSVVSRRVNRNMGAQRMASPRGSGLGTE